MRIQKEKNKTENYFVDKWEIHKYRRDIVGTKMQNAL